MKAYEVRLGHHPSSHSIYPRTSRTVSATIVQCPASSLPAAIQQELGENTGHWYLTADEHHKQKAQKGSNSRRET